MPRRPPTPTVVNVVANAPVRLAEVVLVASAASLDFPGIPPSFRHLQIVVSGRTDRAAVSDSVALRLNGDDSALYDREQLNALASSPTSSEAFGGTSGLCGDVTGNTAAANVASGFTLTIPDYRGGWQKHWYSLGGFHTKAIDVPATTELGVRVVSGAWRSTAVVNRVTLISTNGANFLSGTVATLYGLP